MSSKYLASALLFAVAAGAPEAVFAYIGPGAG